jgi:CheY-like chemotaxis protein
MDGSVQLEQGEGYGSTLSVILPLRWAQRSPGEVKAPEEEAAGVQATNHRILLVDDNATYLELTAAMLERLGFAPELALDGQEALQQLRRNRYGVIFMDLEMPVMDGLAATRELRALEAGTDHRSVVIGVSSYARPQSVGQCLEAGMDELLRKPLDLKALEGVLSRYMGEGERRVVVRHTVPVSSDRARFDPQFLVDQFQDDVPQVYEILETFLEDVFTFRKRLEKMMRTRSMDDLGELGRVLKEVAGNVGAHSLASLGVEFQRIRCNPEAGALAVALEDLKSELEWLTGELQGGNEAAAPRRPRPRKDP